MALWHYRYIERHNFIYAETLTSSFTKACPLIHLISEIKKTYPKDFLETNFINFRPSTPISSSEFFRLMGNGPGESLYSVVFCSALLAFSESMLLLSTPLMEYPFLS